MQGNSVRLRLDALLAAAWLLLAGIPSAHAQASPLDDPTGFWLVAETGPPVNQGLASIPLLGLAVRSQIGNPRAIWEIRREGERFTVEIQSRSIQFAGLTFSDSTFRGEIADPNTTGGRIALDVRIAEGRLKGKLAFPTHTFELDGRPPESVEALRQAYAKASARLSELDGPYVVPEIERLRQENIVLIERIQRVENELRQRGQTVAAVRPPQPDTAAMPRISVNGLTGDLAATRATALRAAPNGTASIVTPVATGQTLIRLAEAPAPGWLLVADARGVVGYVQAAQTGPVAAASPAAARAAREIAISFPAWDAGRAGRRMTVVDSGFVSLVGRVRGDAALRDVRIGDGQTVFNPDGSFTSVLPVPREGRKVRIEAVFASGPSTVLEFEIGVGR